jgi:uncharacterized protein YjeT (DUF2065 family)
MTWFLYLISGAMIAIGACAILYTGETRDTLKPLSSMNRIALSTLPVAFGVLMIISASACLHPWLIRFLGLLGVAKGVFIFMNPKGMYQKTLQWYFESVSDQGHRLMGMISVILGTAVLSWIV